MALNQDQPRLHQRTSPQRTHPLRGIHTSRGPSAPLHDLQHADDPAADDAAIDAGSVRITLTVAIPSEVRIADPHHRGGPL